MDSKYITNFTAFLLLTLSSSSVLSTPFPQNQNLYTTAYIPGSPVASGAPGPSYKPVVPRLVPVASKVILSPFDLLDSLQALQEGTRRRTRTTTDLEPSEGRNVRVVSSTPSTTIRIRQRQQPSRVVVSGSDGGDGSPVSYAYVQQPAEQPRRIRVVSSEPQRLPLYAASPSSSPYTLSAQQPRQQLQYVQQYAQQAAPAPVYRSQQQQQHQPQQQQITAYAPATYYPQVNAPVVSSSNKRPGLRLQKAPVLSLKNSGRQQVAEEQEQEEYPSDPNPQYNFSFDVKDDDFTNYQNRQESRDGGVIKGSYSVVDPDGYVRTVTYSATPEGGFQAKVTREPTDVKIKFPVPTQAPEQVPSSNKAGPQIQYASQGQQQQAQPQYSFLPRRYPHRLAPQQQQYNVQ